ncbi:MAG: helix-turn-helix transcriptional regulator [Bacteroidota bacterium]
MKNHIRELRVERKLTQEDLAEILGISRQSINAIEKEKFDPSLTTAFKMAQLFERPIEELFIYQSEE